MNESTAFAQRTKIEIKLSKLKISFMKSTMIRCALICLMFFGWGTVGTKAQQTYGPIDALRGGADSGSDGAPGVTGVPDINISLLKSFPVSLSYDASGIRPDQLPSTVGLGWKLSAGGEVRRVVHGLRDEINNMRPQGLTAAQDQAWRSVSTSSPSTAPIDQMLFDINNSKLDTAPDEFQYNVIGRSGVFIFKPDGSVISDRKIKVQVSAYPGSVVYSHTQPNNIDDPATISGIVITFEDGVECAFKQMQTNNHIFASAGYGAYVHRESQSLNNWKVTKISYPNTINSIVFEYATGLSEYERYSSDDIMVTSNSRIMLTAMSGRIRTNTCYVSRITGGDFDIRFTYNQNANYPDFHYVESIASYAVNGDYLQTFQFSYNWISPTKFLLGKIELVNTSTNPAKKSGNYRFEYNTGTQIPEFRYFPYQDFFALKELGGATGYTYDNTIDVPAPITNTAGLDYWGYYNGVKAPYQSLVTGYASTNLSFSGRPLNQHQVTSLSDRDPDPTVSQALILNKITFPSGGYTQYVFENNDYSYIPGQSYLSSKLVAGGLRIKQLIKCDGINTPVVVKSYDYTSADYPNLSSGVLEHDIVTDSYFSRYPISFCTLSSSIQISTPFSVLPASIGYSRIKETNPDGSYTVYDYTTAKGYTSYGNSRSYTMIGCPDMSYKQYSDHSHYFLYVPHQIVVMRGLLTKKEDFSAAGLSVKSVSLTYDRFDVGGVLSFEQQFIPTKPDNVAYNVGGSTYYDDCYCSKGNSFAPGYPDDYFKFVDWYFARVYNRVISLPVLTRKVERSYDQNSTTHYREADVTFTFNPGNFKYSSIVKRDNVEMAAQNYSGVSVREEFYYPTDYTIGAGMNTALVQANRLTEILEHRTYRNGNLIGAEFNEFGATSNSAEKKYKLELNTPMTTPFVFNPGNPWENYQSYKLQGEVIYNNNAKRVESIRSKSAPAAHTIYGYNGTMPIATITGAPLVYNQSGANSGITLLGTYNGYLSAANAGLSFTVNSPYEIMLEVCISTTNSYISPMSIYLENTDTGKRLFSHILTSPQEGACTSGAGAGRRTPFVISVSPGSYRIFGNGSEYVNITASKGEALKNAFYTSFEDYSLSSIRSGGKTGDKCMQGVFNIQLPYTPGDYVVSYWTSPNATTQVWTYNESVVVVANNGGSTMPLGTTTGLIDEVRIYPKGSAITTRTYKQGRGINYSMDNNGLLEVTEYDEFGRVKIVKDTNLDITNYNQYKVGAP